ncbi:hypothetical protein RUM43_000947 [Polyplax serrata]|uniref:peptidylprolyl isomerase n=1 Tax=Polyplax serrata TaxID=468196 RepID=A0AAN8XPF1_POLSC
MTDMVFSEEAIKDYCFDYNVENEEIRGSSYRKTNPKELLKEINLTELLNGKDVQFEVSRGYDESILEQADPDIFNEVLYQESDFLRENRGAPPINCTFNQLKATMQDVTENGFVKKQIIRNGYGDVVPENSYVTVEYNMYLEDYEMPFDSTYLRKSPEKFRLDQVETILGLHYAVKSMKKGENSRFFISWEYGFGALGCPDRIKPKSDILADITLIDFVEIECEEEINEEDETVITNNFKKSLNKAKEHHFNGTQEFKKGDTFHAITSFRKGLRILIDLPLNNDEEEKAMLRQKVKCLVNLAVCYNKMGKFEQACLACQDILAIDSNNAKGCFHYGRAALCLSNFDMARKYLMRAAKLKPQDKDVNNELKKLNEKQNLHKIETKDFWEKAFKVIQINEDKKEQSN